ncbi:MAG TPA: hypothetical protein VMV86_06815 [Methanosarcinales archaeon]|nr:hypothetical protein [Methanosarcinales archaeon]
MKTLKYEGAFHFWPSCCAEKIGSSNYKTGNWLWLFWMFCFGENNDNIS